MAKIGSPLVKILISATQGGAANQDISTQVLNWSGFPIESMTEDGHGYSEAWSHSESVGMRSMGDISLSLFFDAAAGTAYTLLNAAQAANEHRKFRAELGTTAGDPYKEADVWVASLNISAERGALVKADVSLRLASVVTEGTI